MQRQVLELRLRRGAQVLGRFHVLAHHAGGPGAHLDAVAALGPQLAIEVVFPKLQSRHADVRVRPLRVRR